MAVALAELTHITVGEPAGIVDLAAAARIEQVFRGSRVRRCQVVAVFASS